MVSLRNTIQFFGGTIIALARISKVQADFSTELREFYDGTVISAHPDLLSWMEGNHLEDNFFQQVPDEPGVYSCTVRAEWSGDYEEADLDLYIENPVKMFEFPETTREDREREWPEYLNPTESEIAEMQAHGD